MSFTESPFFYKQGLFCCHQGYESPTASLFSLGAWVQGGAEPAFVAEASCKFHNLQKCQGPQVSSFYMLPTFWGSLQHMLAVLTAHRTALKGRCSAKQYPILLLISPFYVFAYLLIYSPPA